MGVIYHSLELLSVCLCRLGHRKMEPDQGQLDLVLYSFKRINTLHKLSKLHNFLVLDLHKVLRVLVHIRSTLA